MSLEADPSHALDDARGRLRAAAICLADFRRESGQAEAAPAGGDIGSVGLTAALRQTRQALEDRSREAESLRQRVAELERRLLDVARSREAKLDELDSQMAQQRRVLEDLRVALLRSDQALVSLLATHRTQLAGTQGLDGPFRELDALRALLPS